MKLYSHTMFPQRPVTLTPPSIVFLSELLLRIRSVHNEITTRNQFGLQLSCFSTLNPEQGHCAALTHGGEVLSWGNNDFGQLGIGKICLYSRGNFFFISLRLINIISRQNYGHPDDSFWESEQGHCAAVTYGGEVLAWGNNDGSGWV